jgi:hypothetical protein
MSTSTFIRAFSPSLGAITSTIAAASDHGAPRDLATKARQSSLAGCNHVHEIIELIPSDYRSVLNDLLHALVVQTGKLRRAEKALADALRHQTAGTFPSSLRGTVPSIQVTSEFAKTDKGRAFKTKL